MATQQVQSAAPVLPGYYEPLRRIPNGRNQIWEARDTRTERKVVIKAIPEHSHLDLMAMGRIWMDFDCGQLIRCRQVVPSIELIDTADTVAFSMEAVPGPNLRMWLEDKGHLSFVAAVRIAIEMAMALEAVHAHGIIHCDVKLANFLMDSDSPRLIDFEIAQFEGRNPWSESGMVSASAQYCSPEQGLGQPLDARTDIYSLGICLFRMLAGQMPFSASAHLATAILHVTAPLPEIWDSRPDVPAQLVEVVERCCEKHPDDRFQTVTEIRQALEGMTL